MRDSIRQIFRRWLNGPSEDPLPKMQDQLQSLQHRLSSLEALVLAHTRGGDNPSPLFEESVDEGLLGDLPDAHLGAQ
jgi:hypothetical protein